MSCIGAIREHISLLPDDAIFATRDLVKYGLRTTVDQSISQLILSGVIVRLARGIFIKSVAQLPSVLDIAAYKARSFGKELVTHGHTLASHWLASTDSGVHQTSAATNQKQQPDLIFQIRGRSSAFLCGDKRVYLQGTSDRRIRGGETQAGQLIRTLWHLGSQVSETSLWKKIESIPVPILLTLIDQAQWMPAWLSDTLRRACYI